LTNPRSLGKCRIFEEIDGDISNRDSFKRRTLPREYAVTQVKRENDNDLYEHVSKRCVSILRNIFTESFAIEKWHYHN